MADSAPRLQILIDVLQPLTLSDWIEDQGDISEPGEPLHLAAPNVLCVQDRRLSGLQIGVLLRPQRRSETLGLTQGLVPYVETGEAPTVTFEDQRIKVNGQPVTLPFLRRCAHHAVARAGFVAACAIDSQRLWIVEAD